MSATPASGDTDLDLDLDVEDVDRDPDATKRIEPQVHEFRCKFLWAENGLSPYWYLRQQMLEVWDGYIDGPVEFEVDDETWVLEQAFYPDGGGGLAPRDDMEIETVYEFWFKAHKKENERVHASYHVAPTWRGIQSKSGKDVNPPASVEEGVVVDLDKGANVQDLSKYIRIWHAILDVVGLQNQDYFRTRDIHPYSSIIELAVYVRLRRDVAERIIDRDGIIKRIVELLTDGNSSSGEYKWDDEDVDGYYHHVKVDRQGAGALVPGHRYGKRLKHYHPKFVRDDPEDPLAHPKIEVPFSKKMNDGNAAPWVKADDLLEELDELLINVLHWSQIPTRGIPGIYIPDGDWSVRETDRNVALYDDPTPEIEASQHSLALRYFVREPTLESTFDIFRAITDGGRKHVTEVEDDVDYSERTIYRFLRRMGDIVESYNGEIRWKSEYLRKQIKSIVEEAEKAAERFSWQALDAINRSQAREASALQKWLSRYAVDFEDAPKRVRFRIELGSYSESEMREIIRKGLNAWAKAGKQRSRFEDAVFHWTSPDGEAQTAKALRGWGGEWRILGVSLRRLERKAAR
ncbi:hypothetical protein ACFQH6_19605 [Halobacteriaceae archaeon GCM10025711]